MGNYQYAWDGAALISSKVAALTVTIQSGVLLVSVVTYSTAQSLQKINLLGVKS